MVLNRSGSVVRGAFATEVTMAWRQPPEIWEVWGERYKMRERVRAMCGLRVLRALGKSPPGPDPLLGLRASMARWVSDCVHLCAWVESGSGPFICMIKTLKCLFEKICHFLACGCSGAIWME